MTGMVSESDIQTLIQRWREQARTLEVASTATRGMDPAESHGMQCQATSLRAAAGDLADLLSAPAHSYRAAGR